mgnify:CR=1 FL=1
MPRLNYYITTTADINLKDFPELKLTKQTQLTALKIWLANLVKYEDKVIAFSRSKNQIVDEMTNPLRVGYSSINNVWDRLSEANLIKSKAGVPRWLKDEQEQFIQPELSSATSTKKLLKLCNALKITKDSIKEIKSPVHVRMRDWKNKKLTTYKPTPYTKETERLMSEYCNYLNNQKIKFKDKVFEDIHLHRTYSNRRDNLFQFGGRSGGEWMSLKEEERNEITINGKKTISIDMHCSQLSILYKASTGNYLDPADDAYKIDGIDKKFRPVIKRWLLIMLNVSYKGVGLAMSNFNKKQDKEFQSLYAELLTEYKPVEITNKIIERHKSVNHLFCLGATMGQHYAWLEANMVFNVAHQCCLYHDVPCLTVHDEYIVPKNGKDTLEMLMYSTGLDSDIYKSVELKL